MSDEDQTPGSEGGHDQRRKEKETQTEEGKKEGRKEGRKEGKSKKHEKSAPRRVRSIGASIKLRMHAVSRVLMNERLVDAARGQRLE